METTYTILAIIITLVVIVAIKISSGSEKRKVFKNNTYAYTAKSLPMSPTEAEFFGKLNGAVSERYYVFPQVHLSALLVPSATGKAWSYAFWHINGKSVDFVLCDKQTLKPTYVIELDDYTHKKRVRVERDAEVERIFSETQFPLVRFANKNVSEQEIVQALMSAKASIS